MIKNMFKWLKLIRWIKNIIRKVCEWNIIISKTTLASMDLMDDLRAMNKTFKNKTFRDV